MAISEGDKLPDASFTIMGDEGPTGATTADVFGGKKVVLFGVPGAFTPTCHSNHLPTFLARRDDLMAKGVDTIACVSVNDIFVLNAWSKATASNGDIMMLADGSGDFVSKTGMELDLTERGLGVRSKRFVALVEDGTVKTLLVEDNPGEAEQSTADALLATM